MGPLATGPQPNIKHTNLEYLLHDRRAVWGESDHGTALGKTIKTAATGHDPASARLAFATTKILADDARTNFTVKDGKVAVGDKSPFGYLKDGHLGDAIARPHHYDELSGLRPAMAEVLVAHLDRLHDIVRLSKLDERPGSTGMTGEDLDYLLLDVTRNASAYETLLMGQVAHARLAVDRTIAGHGDLTNTVKGEGHMFGHLLEARHQSVGAEEARLAEDLDRMRKYVGYGIGLIPVGTDLIAQRSPVGGEVYSQASAEAANVLTNWFVRRLADKAEPTIFAPKTETEGVERLFNQMIASSLVTHGRLTGKDLAGKPFATEGHDPKLLPIGSLDGRALEGFLRWANDRLKIDNFSDDVETSVGNGQKTTAGHYRSVDGKTVTPSGRR
ncbi:hypothetical protein E1298_46305 [Actinomadura rubrisoli]|uniref:Uncharacterized protein n=2 Tax=Actinomadura rubrisoli TaxID=2530368 RepID=A0A4R4ZQ80_9ACTN|nr:hypothetical protein E1298_46305 [Actinomadura rubrisoli]